MTIQQLDPKAAWELLQNTPDAYLIDVRTEQEFTAGHPAPAKNIPIHCTDPRNGLRMPNAEFPAVVSAHVPKNATVVLTCHSGGRSMMAAMVLESVGYEKLVNVKGGFAGSDSTPGWEESGLPVSHTVAADAGYEHLSAAVKK